MGQAVRQPTEPTTYPSGITLRTLAKRLALHNVSQSLGLHGVIRADMMDQEEYVYLRGKVCKFIVVPVL